MQNISLIIDNLMKKWSRGLTPGFAISVVNCNDTSNSYYYGMANLEHAIPISENTVFYLCSLSKQFTAFCLSTLINENKISLSDPIRKFLPQLPDQIYGAISISHLAHMTSGIHEWYDMMEYSGSYTNEYPWRKSIIPLLMRQQYLSFAPGERFSYCNTNYVLLTLIIEQITQKSLAEYARQTIFRPLNMNSTCFCEDNNRLIPHTASGYYKIGDNLKTADKLPPLIGAGGVYSTLNDLTIWLKAIISKQWQPHIFQVISNPSHFNNGKPNPYLMGFQRMNFHCNHVIHHGGAIPGFFTHICYIPLHNCGFIWLANHNNFKPDVITNAVLKLLQADFSATVPENTNSISICPETLHFTGKYLFLNEVGSLHLEAENKTLLIKGNPTRYQHDHDNIFINPDNNYQMIIMSEYHQNIILRLISNNSDKFLIKADQLPSQTNIQQYCGRFYSSELDVTYSFTESQNNLYIDAVKKFSGTDLRLIAHDIFLSPTKGIKIRFQRDDDNQIVSLFLDSFRSQKFFFNKITSIV